jgi:transposase InsO family protein
MCIDYRKVNALTYKDAYPLPKIDACLDVLGGARWFSSLDLRSGYWQVEILPDDRDKTAFVTRRGQFRFKVLPFGLCNAVGLFQRLQDRVLAGLNWFVCLVYLDDIAIFSKTFDEHVVRLDMVFERMQAAGLKFNPEKCRLFQRRMEFLGYVISARGVEPAADKVKAVKEWPTPRNVYEVRAFLGLIGYYRRWIEGFSRRARPLYELLRKEVRFHWLIEQQLAFDDLKVCLTSAPILGLPIDNGEYVLDTDASDYAAGAVLQQRQDGVIRVIAYASRTFHEPETRYSTNHKELTAAVYGLSQFRQYLLGRSFLLRTDHAALKFLMTTKDVSARHGRHLDFLAQFGGMRIEHRPGTSHGNGDGMSRRPAGNETNDIGSIGTLGSIEIDVESSAGVTADTGDVIELDPVAIVTTDDVENDDDELTMNAVNRSSTGVFTGCSDGSGGLESTVMPATRSLWSTDLAAPAVKSVGLASGQDGTAVPATSGTLSDSSVGSRMTFEETDAPPGGCDEPGLKTTSGTRGNLSSTESLEEMVEQHLMQLIEPQNEKMNDLNPADARRAAETNLMSEVSDELFNDCDTSELIERTGLVDKDVCRIGSGSSASSKNERRKIRLITTRPERFPLVVTSSTEAASKESASTRTRQQRDQPVALHECWIPEAVCDRDALEPGGDPVVEGGDARSVELDSTASAADELQGIRLDGTRIRRVPLKVTSSNRPVAELRDETTQADAATADADTDSVDLLSSICEMDIQQEVLKDTSLSVIIELIEQGITAPDPAILTASGWEFLIPQWKLLYVENGLLKKRYPDLTVGGPRDVIVLPRTMQRQFVEACHIESGHQGREKTAELVQRRVYFPRWRSMAADVCANCVLCATYSDSKKPKQGVMQIMEVKLPMDRIAIDLTGPHPTSKRSNRFILTMVDCFSRYLIAVPIRNKYATTVAKAVNRYLFARWGLCRELLTDQGTEFDNKLMKTLCLQYGIRKVRTSGYRPSANGRIERLHRSLNALLAKTVNEHHNDWDEILDAVVAQYNGTVHRSTGFTPNRLMLGRETLTSLDLLLPFRTDADDDLPSADTTESSGTGVTRSSTETSPSSRQPSGEAATTSVEIEKYVDAMHERLSSVYGTARQKSLKAALKRKIVYDRAVKQKSFDIGQLVLLRIEPCKPGLYNKWRLNFEGPFLVKQKLSSVNYVITRLNGSKPRVVHVDRLRHCSKTAPRRQLTAVRRRSGGRQASEAGDVTDFISDPLRRSVRPGRGCQKHPKYHDYV